MVINHIEKLFVTNDAATILRELEVQHPAAKMIVMACQQQEQEVGDGTNFVMIFAGALLESAEMLIRMVRNFLFYPINVQWSIMKIFYIEVLFSNVTLCYHCYSVFFSDQQFLLLWVKKIYICPVDNVLKYV